MPRRRSPPRLYLDKARSAWVIRDGASFVRTGCLEADVANAAKQLESYLEQKHEPERGPSPLISDVLNVYATEHVPHTKTASNNLYSIGVLGRWFGGLRMSDITARTCREYAASRPGSGPRRDLEILRAAIGYWIREYGPVSSVPILVFPPKQEARDRWLTRSEAARLLYVGRHQPHLRRFILLGLYTGSRPTIILSLTWDQIDLERGVMRRRPSGEAEDARKRTPPVRLGKRILSHLRRWRRLDSAEVKYLCHYDGVRVAMLKTSFPAAVKRAGLSKVTPHTLRHTRATWLMQKGVDMWQAAGHLGMTVETLQRTYGHHHPDFQKDAADV